MPDKVELNTFPSTRLDALTLLYVQSNMPQNCTPEKLADLYDEGRSRISERLKENAKSKRQGWPGI